MIPLIFKSNQLYYTFYRIDFLKLCFALTKQFWIYSIWEEPYHLKKINVKILNQFYQNAYEESQILFAEVAFVFQ